MRDTVPRIISLPCIRATLDDLNGPEVTFLSLSVPSAPLCVSVNWYRATTNYLRWFSAVTACSWYSVTITH